MSHHEKHRSHRVGWLRAAVLGANDGIVSNSSLIVGVAAANATQTQPARRDAAAMTTAVAAAMIAPVATPAAAATPTAAVEVRSDAGAVRQVQRGWEPNVTRLPSLSLASPSTAIWAELYISMQGAAASPVNAPALPT